MRIEPGVKGRRGLSFPRVFLKPFGRPTCGRPTGFCCGAVCPPAPLAHRAASPASARSIEGLPASEGLGRSREKRADFTGSQLFFKVTRFARVGFGREVIDGAGAALSARSQLPEGCGAAFAPAPSAKQSRIHVCFSFFFLILFYF